MRERSYSDAEEATILRLRAALDELVRDTDDVPSALDGVYAIPRRPGPQRTRRRRLATAALAVAACALVVAGVLATTNSQNTAVTVGRAQCDVSTPARPLPTSLTRDVTTYDLQLASAELLPFETETARIVDTALWGNEETQTYLSLTVWPGSVSRSAEPEPSAMGPMTEDHEFPVEKGRAWFTDAAAATSQSMKMWWARRDGDLWLLSAYWYGAAPTNIEARRATLREWALAIEHQPEDKQMPSISIASMKLWAYDRASDVGSRARVWQLDGQEITLLVINASSATGRSNLLEQGDPLPVTIAGCQGWQVSGTPTGTIVGWPIDSPQPSWATLTIPPSLANQTTEILQALTVVA